MKKIIRFSRYFLPAAIFSLVLIISGIAGYIAFGGFNIGVDFQAGLIQEVQFAPTAFHVSWEGRGNATLEFRRASLSIVVTGTGIEDRAYVFPFSDYPTVGELTEAMKADIEGLIVDTFVSERTSSQWLVQSALGNPQLGTKPYIVHYLAPDSEPISIGTVREAMSSLGQTVSVQNMGQGSERHFMIRMEDKDIEEGENVSAERITAALEGYFGSGGVVILRADYVGSRFSKDLSDKAGMLLGLTLLIILIYASIRFKPQYAIGAVLAILHDGLIMVAFVAWTRLEFNTSTIAAIMTILGYSINDTIVVFDRIRETRRIYPDDAYVNILDRAITETLSRTIITTVTTMLAVVFLFIFVTGSMKDFSLLLMVGMVSGVYSTIFIASGFIHFWELRKSRREKRKLASAVPVKA
jgi:preprotein translocase subunit SecF